MTKIIGHRGAAGLALENSKAGLKAALDCAVDAIEFDVRRTSDGELVLMHDRHTGRIASRKITVGNSTLAELKDLTLRNGEQIITLAEALDIIGSQKPVVIHTKDSGMAEKLLEVLAEYPEVKAEFTSFHHRDLALLHKARPESPILVLEHFSPFEIIHTARRMQATGISLNMWLMNPLTYRLAKRYGLELRAYTINHPFIARLFKRFYPDVAIYTDRPDRFCKKPAKKTRKIKAKTKANISNPNT